MKILGKLFGNSSMPPNAFRDRVPLATLDFCGRCSLDLSSSSLVDDFRRAFSRVISVEPELIYPEDEAAIFGIDYSDDLAMFLFDNGLLTDKRYRYDFPMEEASAVGDIIKIFLALNRQAEQGAS
tara:strand:+ start:337 stop:711 length:375 start_codon:yes stop_codon:yes gene_type:complete